MKERRKTLERLKHNYVVDKFYLRLKAPIAYAGYFSLYRQLLLFHSTWLPSICSRRAFLERSFFRDLFLDQEGPWQPCMQQTAGQFVPW